MMSSHMLFMLELLKGKVPANKTIAQWRDVIRLARASEVLPRIAQTLLSNNAKGDIPEPAYQALQSSIRHVTLFHNQVRFESQEIAANIQQCCNSKVILLKGSAYVAAGLRVGKGRIFSDLDILVDKSSLPIIEMQLSTASWQPIDTDDYDQKYYREWAHEIPPLRHTVRNSVLDIHHNIIPPISGKAPAIGVFTESLQPIGKQMYVLDTPAMVLHSIVHLFYQEEFHHGFRDLSDLYLFFDEHKDDRQFWTKLKELAQKTDFELEVFLAYRYVDYFYAIGNQQILSVFNDAKPSSAKLALLDWIFLRVLTPEHPLNTVSFHRTATLLALVRGHMLKMPIHILLLHTLRKISLNVRLFFTGDKKKRKSEDQQLR